MSQAPAPIIIIGAARSGTHLLATLLQEKIDCAYAGEVNDLWRSIPGVPKHDAIPVGLATDTTRQRLRDRLDAIRLAQGKGILMEKTAANCLRMPFIYSVFPDAWYIHIVRDGRDVACSAQKKYLGDARKQTSGKHQASENTTRRASRLVGQIKHKLANGLSISQLVRNPGRYLNGALSTLGIRKKAMWGPRFPGMAEVFGSYPLLHVGGLQWRYAVESIANFVEATHPQRYFELTFEDLMHRPELKLNEVLTFLGNEMPPREGDTPLQIKSQSTTWRETLSQEEAYQLEQLIGSTLAKYGYHDRS